MAGKALGSVVGFVQPGGKSPQFAVCLPPAVHAELQEYAFEHGITISAAIRSAVIKMLRNKNGK